MKLLCTPLALLLGNLLLAQSGVYTYGDYGAIYLEDDDGNVDSSFSMCAYGQLELHRIENSLYFDLQVCNATYHTGYINGVAYITSDTTAEFHFDNGQEYEQCHLKFVFRENSVSIDELDCIGYHGARASFYGEFDKVGELDLNHTYLAKEVESTVMQFFQHFNAKEFDELELMAYPSASVTLASVGGEGENVPVMRFMDFVKSMRTSKLMYEEKVMNLNVRVEDRYASCWMDYYFFINDNIHHCGINHITMVNTEDGWKILTLHDTRRTTGCYSNIAMESDETMTENVYAKQVNLAMDAWHKAASDADAESFFGFMSEDCIYLGTDASERWTKEEFLKFAKPYFDRGKAWSFTANWRNVYFNEDYSIAWFEESLDTWMNECRGSGILRREGTEWKLVHYNLAVTIDNDKIQDFIKLVTE